MSDLSKYADIVKQGKLKYDTMFITSVKPRGISGPEGPSCPSGPSGLSRILNPPIGPIPSANLVMGGTSSANLSIGVSTFEAYNSNDKVIISRRAYEELLEVKRLSKILVTKIESSRESMNVLVLEAEEFGIIYHGEYFGESVDDLKRIVLPDHMNTK